MNLLISPVTHAHRKAVSIWLDRQAARPWLPANWQPAEALVETGTAHFADQDEIWGAWQDGSLQGAVRARILPGRMAQLSGLRLNTAATQAVLTLLMERLHTRLRDLGTQLVVALSVDEPQFDVRIEPLLAAGYELAARSTALIRPIAADSRGEHQKTHAASGTTRPTPPQPPVEKLAWETFLREKQTVADPLSTSPEGPPLRPGRSDSSNVTWVRYREGETNRLVRCLDMTYVGSLDAPRLSQLRDTRDAVETYVHLDHTERRIWYFLQESGTDVGCLLLQDHPRDNQLELLYLGLVPAFRGSGLGQRCLAYADRIGHELGRRTLVTCVDPTNSPAVRLYLRAGFEPLHTNRLLVASLAVKHNANRLITTD
jgi:RimJ/RimL family protein N-acetyltransferase